jgi:hypothetical protein
VFESTNYKNKTFQKKDVTYHYTMNILSFLLIEEWDRSKYSKTDNTLLRISNVKIFLEKIGPRLTTKNEQCADLQLDNIYKRMSVF